MVDFLPRHNESVIIVTNIKMLSEWRFCCGELFVVFLLSFVQLWLFGEAASFWKSQLPKVTFQQLSSQSFDQNQQIGATWQPHYHPNCSCMKHGALNRNDSDSERSKPSPMTKCCFCALRLIRFDADCRPRCEEAVYFMTLLTPQRAITPKLMFLLSLLKPWLNFKKKKTWPYF